MTAGLVVGYGLFGNTSGMEKIPQTAAELPFFGSLSLSSILGIVLLDPFAILQAAAAAKDFTMGWLIGILPIVVFYGIIRGRALE